MLSLINARETFFFGLADEKLCQWVIATIDNRGTSPCQIRIIIQAGSMTAETILEVQPGIHEYCLNAPFDPENPCSSIEAEIFLQADVCKPGGRVMIGSHRPWTIYVLADVCTDYAWVYDQEADFRADDAALMKAELDLALTTCNQLLHNRNRYNCIHTRQVEFFLEHYPDQAEQLFFAIRQGMITLSPLFNMCLTGAVSLEELIRQFYPARALAEMYDLPLRFANYQETPTTAWITTSLLAGIGIHHLNKAIYPYECPWVSRYVEPPVFQWQGPDGSRILVRRRNVDYIEANFILKGVRAANQALHEKIIPEYERLAEAYKFSAIGLLGVYGDLSPQSAQLAEQKVSTVHAYNAQGWEFPKLVNASPAQFWEHIDQQIQKEGIQLPVMVGDYGSSWDVWPSSLAAITATWRKVQRLAPLADTLCALGGSLAPEWYEDVRVKLKEGWDNLIYLADHAWNGDNKGNRELNVNLRRSWSQRALAAFDYVIAEGLECISHHLEPASEERLIVFNGLGWRRDDLVCIEDFPPGHVLVDLTSQQKVASQHATGSEKQGRYFAMTDIPPIGYRAFAIRRGDDSLSLQYPGQAWYPKTNCLESPYYRLEIDPQSGAVSSLFDKTRQVELAKAGDYQLNQALYVSEGVEFRGRVDNIEQGQHGELFGELIVSTALKNTCVRTTNRLYANIDRLDIENQVTKKATSEKQEFDFIFPFQIPGCQVRYNSPGVIINPIEHMLPGAGLAVIAIRDFVDLFNDDYGVTIGLVDSYQVMFGRRTTEEDPLSIDPQDGTLYLLVMQNCIDWQEAVRDQAGEEQFTFRFHLQGHAGGFHAQQALRFSHQASNLLQTTSLKMSSGHLPAGEHSFVNLDAEQVHLNTIKPGENGGLAMRLWEFGGKAKTVSIAINGLGRFTTAQMADILERPQSASVLQENRGEFLIQANQIQTILFSPQGAAD